MMIHDFDSTFPQSSDFNTYFKQALGFQKQQATLKSWLRTPPQYSCIKGSKQEKNNNLQEYLGKWMTEEQFQQFFADKQA
ncbi:unnamed protein product [Paramecium sonneborni]|uniref:Uncharacterized protein n=1 Tax=Paramecium sonneborni TaxID=65129 RepID=A0A8S1RMV7_9CILI|nr:unnamed protein product [Paramecium sonneborni]